MADVLPRDERAPAPEPRWLDGVKVCGLAHCDRPARKVNMCTMHYARWCVGGDLDKPNAGTPRECAVEGCAERVEARDWCKPHYARWLRYGDATHIPPSSPYSPVPHGTYAGFSRGCRCEECVASGRDYHSNYYETHREYLNEWSRRHYAQNAERFREYARTYRVENRDEIRIRERTRYAPRRRAAGRAYYRRHWDKRRAAAKARYEANRKEILDGGRVYRSTEKGRRAVLAAHARRRARLMEAECGCVTGDAIASIYAATDRICVYCGGVADTLDHVHPLVKGGMHCIENLVPACRSCNCSKQDKILPPERVPAALFSCEKRAKSPVN